MMDHIHRADDVKRRLSRKRALAMHLADRDVGKIPHPVAASIHHWLERVGRHDRRVGQSKRELAGEEPAATSDLQDAVTGKRRVLDVVSSKSRLASVGSIPALHGCQCVARVPHVRFPLALVVP